MTRSFAACTALLIALTVVDFQSTASGVANAVARQSHVADEVLVKLKGAPSSTAVYSAAAVRGHAVISELRPAGWVRIRLGRGQTVAQAIASYRSDPAVERAQPNYLYRAALRPNDPQYDQLWSFRNIGQAISGATWSPDRGTIGEDMNIEKAWDHITDCRSVVVAVVDSGVNYQHEDLAPNMWNGGVGFPRHGWDFIDEDDDPIDPDGHGTHVAGIIGAAGNNSLGITGVCWQASIMAVRVLDAAGFGTSASVAQGVDFAVANGAKVINMSLGGPGFDPLLSQAITNAQDNDVVVVAAAGNDGIDIDAFGGDYPCSFTHYNLICVAAVDQNYALTTFSNFGANSVDVGAPGANILSVRSTLTTTLADDFRDSNDNLDWLKTGDWAYRRLTLSGQPVDVLANPSSFPSLTGRYQDGADHRVYKIFDLTGAVGAVLNFDIEHHLAPGDLLNVHYRRQGGDPFDGGDRLDQFSGDSGGISGLLSYDLSACAGMQCSVGFQLATDASGNDRGVGIGSFSIELNALTTTVYRVASGTSMATPQVAGLAAMLRAYNPLFRADDTVTAIKNAGRSVASLAGVSTSGRAVDAMSSLAYINTPTGLQATISR